MASLRQMFGLGPKKTRPVAEEREKNAGRQYMDTVYTLARAARAWRFVSFVMLGLVIFMGFQSYKVTQSMPVRLIPYGFATQSTPATIKNKKVHNAEYLSLIAASDMGLYMTWTPDTVEPQYRRFLTRLAPALYSQKQIELINKAKSNSIGFSSQAFFVRDSEVIGKNKVVLQGVFRQWEGRELIAERNMEYTMVYRFVGGIPYIRSIQRTGDH